MVALTKADVSARSPHLSCGLLAGHSDVRTMWTVPTLPNLRGASLPHQDSLTSSSLVCCSLPLPSCSSSWLPRYTSLQLPQLQHRGPYQCHSSNSIRDPGHRVLGAPADATSHLGPKSVARPASANGFKSLAWLTSARGSEVGAQPTSTNRSPLAARPTQAPILTSVVQLTSTSGSLSVFQLTSASGSLSTLRPTSSTGSPVLNCPESRIPACPLDLFCI